MRHIATKTLCQNLALIASIGLTTLVASHVQANSLKSQAKEVALSPSSAPSHSGLAVKKSAPLSRWRGWHLDLEAATNMPIDMGGRLTLEVPGGFQLGTSLGSMPFFFTDAINAVAVGAKLYDQSTALILKTSLQNSLSWRLHLSWRPHPKSGFYMGMSYGLLVLNGKLAGTSIADAVDTGSLSTLVRSLSFNINSTLHMLSGEIGYQFHFFRDLMSLRLAVGFTGTIAASTKIQSAVSSSTSAQIRTAVQNASNTAAASFDTMYKSYVLSPVVTIATGFRFF